MAVDSYAALAYPHYYLEADGELAQDLAENVLKFEYTERVDKPDILKLTIANVGHRFTADPRLSAGVRYRVRWGYPGDLSPTRLAVISKARPNFPQTGVPVIEMVAFDLSLELHRGGHSQNWGEISSSEVARRVAARYNLKIDIVESDDARRQARVQGANTTDVLYLQKLAQVLNWAFYIENDTLHFHPHRYSQAAVLNFHYFSDSLSDLVTFQPEIDLSKPSATGQAGADTQKGKTAATDAKPDDAHGSPDKKAGRYVIDTNRGTGELVTNFMRSPVTEALVEATPETNPKVVKKQALSRQGKIDMGAVKATLTVLGTPKLRAKSMISVSGVTRLYSGKWYVEEASHVIQPTSPVYVVSCKINRNAASKGKKEDQVDPSKVSADNDGSNAEKVERVVVIGTNFGTVDGFSNLQTRPAEAPDGAVPGSPNLVGANTP